MVLNHIAMFVVVLTLLMCLHEDFVSMLGYLYTIHITSLATWITIIINERFGEIYGCIKRERSLR